MVERPINRYLVLLRSEKRRLFGCNEWLKSVRNTHDKRANDLENEGYVYRYEMYGRMDFCPKNQLTIKDKPTLSG